MPLGMEVGLGSGHIVLDGDPSPSKGGHNPKLFGLYDLLWPNGCMDQDATWYGGSLGPGDTVLDVGPSSP